MLNWWRVCVKEKTSEEICVNSLDVFGYIITIILSS